MYDTLKQFPKGPHIFFIFFKRPREKIHVIELCHYYDVLAHRRNIILPTFFFLVMLEVGNFQ